MVVKKAPSSSTNMSDHLDQFSSSLTDQEYLVRRARAAQVAGNQWEAKSWMLTAKSLFPDNFSIQMEAYTAARTALQFKESAVCLQALCDKFPGEKVLQEEVQAVMAALRAGPMDSKDNKFYVDMFEEISEAGRKRMVISAAESTADPLDHCRLMLILMEKFPGEVTNYGEKLIDTVNTLEKQEAGTGPQPLNHYRKLLVTEVLPAVLRNPSKVKMNPKLLLKNLYKSIEFVVAYVNKKHGGQVNFELKDPWKQLYTILAGAGMCLGWTLALPTSPPSLPPVEELLGQLVGLARPAAQAPPDSPLAQQVFHLSSVCCLQAVFKYTGMVREKEVLLVEAFVTHDVTDKNNKRRKTLDDPVNALPIISHGSSTTLEDPLIHSFQLACSSWQLVSSSSGLEAGFQDLLSQLSATSGRLQVINQFSADFKLQAGQFWEALQEVRQLCSTPSSSLLPVLKLATVQFCLGDQRSAAQSIVDCMSGLSSLQDKENMGISGLTRPTTRTRHLRFLPANRPSVLSYCCRLLSGLLQEKALQHNTGGDLAMGHTIVVLQHNWPEQRELFYLLLHRIKNKESFSYPLFTQYVVNIDILEEMMFLASEQGGGLAIDIVPGVTLGGGRVGTRGANRGERDDFRQAMRKQAMRSHEPVDKIIVEFLTNHTDLILQCLA